jgi:hypothetical protein
MTIRSSLPFQTEVEFELPRGYLDATGILHRRGVMRLATAADEIVPLRDPRVQQNSAYLSIIVLSRVVTRLGTLTDIDPRVIEGLFASDVDHLQRLYERINTVEELDPPSNAAPATSPGRTETRGPRAVGEA